MIMLVFFTWKLYELREAYLSMNAREEYYEILFFEFIILRIFYIFFKLPLLKLLLHLYHSEWWNDKTLMNKI